jgi:hypothetical protein
VGLVWSFSLNYILPIILNAAQLAISSYLHSSNVTMLVDSAKVVIKHHCITSGARVTTLSTKHLIDLPTSSALLGKAEVVAVPPPVAFPDDAIEEATVSIRTRERHGRPPGRSQRRGGAVFRKMLMLQLSPHHTAHSLFAARLDGTE